MHAEDAGCSAVSISPFACLSRMWPRSDDPLVYPPPEGAEYTGSGVASRQPVPPASDDSFLGLVDRRLSVRSFTGTPVSDHDLHNALRVARLAPSAGNLQAYQVVIVRDDKQKREIASAALDQMWIASAPVVLVFLADLDQSGRKYHSRGRLLYSIQDATIAASYTQLALEAAGLSSCWVGAFREDLVASAVGAGQDSNHGLLRPVVVMPVGEAAEQHRRSRRRAIREFVHNGSVGGSSKDDEQLYHKRRSLRH